MVDKPFVEGYCSASPSPLVKVAVATQSEPHFARSRLARVLFCESHPYGAGSIACRDPVKRRALLSKGSF